MRRLVASTVAGLSIAVIYACGGVGNTSATDLGTDHPPSLWENPGSGEPAPNGGEPTGGCTCPAGKWKCGSLTLTIENKNGKCSVDPCTGGFSITVQGQSYTGTFKGNQLCVGGECVSCAPATTTDDGGTDFDTGVKDTGVKDTGPVDTGIKDTGLPDTTACFATACETESICQSTCPAISGTVACCDQTSFTCTYQAGTVCQ